MKADMTNNDNIPYLLCKLIIGKANDEERRVIDKWCEESEYNRETFRRLMDARLLETEHRKCNMADYARPLEDIKRRINEDKKTKRSRTAWRIFAVASAASALLLVTVTLGIYLTRTGVNAPERIEAKTEIKEIVPGHTQATLTLGNGKTVQLGEDGIHNEEVIAEASQGQETEMNDLYTPRGGEFKVVLEDGTEVWLNADTRLRYPEKFANNERRVEVTGEAYFKVAHDSERPFYVVSSGQEVRVYGTEFNVCAYSDEPEIATTLVTGSIALRTLGGNNSELLLTPGHKAVFDKGQATARVMPVDAEVVTSWRNGVFVFEEQTMAQIMHTLSRWYDFDYEFADDNVSKIVFMGSIPRYGSFKEVADIFKKMGGIHLRQKGDKVVISAR